MRHARRVVALQRSAGRCRRAGHTTAAEQLYRRALAVAQRHLPADDLTTARVRNDLAVLLKYTGGFDEAAQLYAAACAVLTAHLGADDPELATVLHNIGGLAHAAGRPGDGEGAARRSVEIRDAAVGADHPDAAADRAALAAILADLGRDDEARTLLDAALPHARRALPSVDASERRRVDASDARPRTSRSRLGGR
jgi:tetratricopeptide (TPR) repeat protein